MASTTPPGDVYAETLSVFERTGAPNEPLTTPEVADSLDCGRRTAYKRLETLADRGELETKKTGARSRVWWRPRRETNHGARAPGSVSDSSLVSDALDSANVGVFVLDSNFDVAWINESTERYFGIDRSDVVGRDKRTLVSETIEDVVAKPDSFAETVLATYEDNTYTEEFECRVGGDGDVDERWLEHRSKPIESGPHAGGRIELYYDVTERKRVHRNLQERETQFRSLVQAIEEYAICLLDPEGHMVSWNSGAERLTGYERDEVIDEHISIFYTDAERADAVPETILSRAAAEGAVEFEGWRIRKDGSRFWARVIVTALRDGDGRLNGYSLITQDLTEHEREIKRYKRLVETVDDGIFALDPDGHLRLVNDALCEMTGFDRDELLGAHPTDVTNISGLEALTERDGPRGAEGGDSERVEFEIDRSDGTTLTVESLLTEYEYDEDVRARCGVIRDVTDRKSYERRLEQQQERLTALDNLNTVVRDINEAVIDQSTRLEIEETVCSSLASADSYEFAWIAEVDPQSDSIRPRVEAGVDGYLEEIPLSVDPDEPTGRGPAGRALRTQEIQVTRNARDDGDFEPWREYASKYGYAAAAGVPLTYEGTIYGLLGVYADRENAFTQEEQAVIGHLGRSIGHAIAAIERRQALMGDDVIEIQFLVPEIFEAIDVPASADGTITLDRTIPLGDDVYLKYGRANDGGLDVLETLVDRYPFWEDVTVVGRGPGENVFEARLHRPPITSLLETHGGNVERSSLQDGDYRMTLHLPTSADVRQFIEEVRDVYPSVELVTRHQVSRSVESDEHIGATLSDELTDRQRAALDAAYHAGYFEWPRARSGEDVAASLDVSASTFHQHLRKAERKVFERILDSGNLSL